VGGAGASSEHSQVLRQKKSESENDIGKMPVATPRKCGSILLHFVDQSSINIMNKLLRDIVRQAVEFTREHRFWGIREDKLLQLLDTWGEGNSHLANPLNRDPSIPYFRPREMLLTGEEVVNGKYMTLVYCGHDLSLYLIAFDSIEEMERSILSGSGILNSWTTYVFAFVDGQLKDYEVVATLDDGSTYTCDNHKGENDDVNLLLFKIVKAEFRWR
jgi:hypothetical protein